MVPVAAPSTGCWAIASWQCGSIVEVYSQGYRYRDDVLRPAKVVVAA